MKKLALLIACAIVGLQFSGMAQNANGLNVTFVEYSTGAPAPAGNFAQTGPGAWKETPANVTYTFNFRETKRDNGSVYLLDPSRNMTIQLDIANRQVVLNWDRAGRGRLYNIIRAVSGNGNVPIVPSGGGTPDPNVNPNDVLTPADKDLVFKWVAQEVAAAKVVYCYRWSYGRTAGEALSTCPPTADKDGALCYPKCRAGFYGVGPVCWQDCPSGYRNDGAYCFKPSSYGRGAGYVIWDEQKCKNDNPQGCEKSGALWYPRCRANFHAAGCCVCSPDCPPGMNDIGVSCQKQSYGRTAGSSMICRDGLEQDGALCYPKCRPNYHGIGPVCWQNCPPSLSFDCAAGCATTQMVCAEKTIDMVETPIMLAINILTLGETSELTAAKSELTAALNAAKTAEGLAAKAAKLKAIKDALAGTIKEYGSAFTKMTTAKVATTLANRFKNTTLMKWVVTEYAKVQIKLVMQQQFTEEDLKGLAGLDPTGAGAVVAAFTQQLCPQDNPFPVLSKPYN